MHQKHNKYTCNDGIDKKILHVLNVGMAQNIETDHSLCITV